ncbi:MAG: YlmC/YmxH family sporulation protein [Clostridiaceae bacterium]
MELPVHSINNIRMLEVIEINSGMKLGFIKDLKIDVENYKIISIILPNNKSGWFGKSKDIEIEWDKVRKVGVDVLLVEDNYVEEDFM